MAEKATAQQKKLQALKLSVFLEWQQTKYYNKIFILSHPRKIKESGSKNISFTAEKAVKEITLSFSNSFLSLITFS